MVTLNITVDGLGKVRRRLDRIRNGVRNLNMRPFAERMKLQAMNFLEQTRKGYANPGNQKHISFFARTERLADGNLIVMWATAKGKDGFNYVHVQESGLPGVRIPVNKKAMRFIGREGTVIFAREVKGIPAKNFMLKTAIWAADAAPAYIEQKVSEVVRRNKGRGR